MFKWLTSELEDSIYSIESDVSQIRSWNHSLESQNNRLRSELSMVRERISAIEEYLGIEMKIAPAKASQVYYEKKSEDVNKQT